MPALLLKCTLSPLTFGPPGRANPPALRSTRIWFIPLRFCCSFEKVTEEDTPVLGAACDFVHKG
jgi:hypothetical protein